MSDYTVVYFTCIKRGFSVASVLAKWTMFGHDFEIRWYGFLIAIGFLLGLFVAEKLAKRGGLNIDTFYDNIIFGTVFAVIGARAYYVIFEWDYYSQHKGEILKINEGGLAIYGGLIAGILAAVVVCRIKKMKISAFLDAIAAGVLIGQGIGRWGNYTNQEAFGTNTSAPWGMTSSKVVEYIQEHSDEFKARGFSVNPDLPVHPTFLYESVCCIAGAVLLYIMYNKWRKFDGQVILSYGIWYGLERTVVEGLRTDSLYIGSSMIRVSQLFSGILAVSCAVILVILLRKAKAGKLAPVSIAAVPEDTSGPETKD